MPEKQRSAITRISLNTATFTGVMFEPTYINFLYGRNGTGKSTIARQIKNNQGLEWNADTQKENYCILTYNQDFIKNNIESYDDMPGVFTINEENIEIQKQIKNKSSEKLTLDKRIGEAFEDKNHKEESKDKVEITFRDNCWDRAGKDFKVDFPNALEGKKQKIPFSSEVLTKKAIKHNRTELKAFYDKVYDSNAKTYPLFNKAEAQAIPSCTLLGSSITGSSDSEFSRFMKALNATDWVKQGHDQFGHNAEGRCPYCQQSIPQDFEKQLLECFDEQYQESLQELTQFRERYREAAAKVYSVFKNNLLSVLPEIDTSSYSSRLDSFSSKVKLNLQKIDNKIKESSTIVALEDIEAEVQALNLYCDSFNSVIQKNNDVVSSRQKNQSDCKREVWEQIAYELKDEVDSYRKSIQDLNDSIDSLQKEIEEKRDQSSILAIEITELSKQGINTSSAIDSINSLLRDSGFQGFMIREKPGEANTYQIIRSDGSHANNLSEAEKNFIAFLYFCQLVRGKQKADEMVKEKIVVIDDPVSSMDSSVLFIVAGLVREMVEVCHNNGDYEAPKDNPSYIHQIFVMTHNAYFHREITYNQVGRFEWVSFFLIKKTDNISYIRECTCQSKTKPTDIENYNPVQNSYAALWSEYNEVQSTIPLLNVIRRILEYYFLQICGYEGSSIRKTILEDNKNGFIKIDEFGNQDMRMFEMASAMLAYLDTGTTGIVDGVNYVDDCIDTDQCHKTFEKIFECMGQSQHYEMMMKKKA